MPGEGFSPSAPAATVLDRDLGLFVQGIDDRLYVNWLLTNSQWTDGPLAPGEGVRSHQPPRPPSSKVISGSSCGNDDQLYMTFRDRTLNRSTWHGPSEGPR